jgi:transcriptional regulator with XRE-family HTH domain
LTPERFIECRQLIGWDRRQIARMLGCSDNTLRQMEAGKQAITAPLAEWMERLARYHARNPIPENWRTRPEKSLEKPP